ncbi:MAG TPA: hypothetical protein VNK04_07680 [Gemmataceae bacterium]|nr:hypothetical protein [Gemmataceae bacterium]
MAAARARDYDEDIQVAAPRPDIYVGLLVISLVALLLGCLFLWLDLGQYPEMKAPKVQESMPRPQRTP